jgi:uncharacterized NAD(P)/FAD-binding protein YdhS
MKADRRTASTTSARTEFLAEDSAADGATTIAIVGAGFSGICLAAHLHRAARRPVHILVFDRSKGNASVAFGTRDPAHLLNGPVSSHSAFDDIPNDFGDFLANDCQAQRFLDPELPIGGQFVPRMLFGSYVERIRANLALPSAAGARMSFINTEVHNIVKEADHIKIVTGDGPFRQADVAVLAVGNPPPRSLASLIDAKYLIDDPWNAGEVRAIPPDAPVVIVGSGQTAIDLALTVASNGHRNSIIMLSRRGRIAVPYVAVDRPYPLDADDIPNRIQPFIGWLRRESGRFARKGGDWRAVVNALRPHTQRIWCGFSVIEKRRFFEHMAPFWYLHRSRLPPRTVQKLSDLFAIDKIRVVAGRTIGVTRAVSHIILQVRPRGRHDIIQMPAGIVINCTGPYWDVRKPQNPLIANMIASGVIRWDDFGAGIAVTPTGVPLDASGRSTERLFAIGPLCRGTLLEIMVVRDIRTQCAALAAQLLIQDKARIAAGRIRRP